MPDLVDIIRGEIDARLEELRPLAREASDLQRARRLTACVLLPPRMVV